MRALAGRTAAACAAVLTLVASALAGCARQEARPTSAVLIVIDTLRADHLSLSGYRRDTSPRLVELAREGTTFRRCYAHSSSTRPSVTTILTSRLVSAHGVVTHGRDALATEIPYLPDLLHAAGLHTLAVVANPQIHPRLGFARGFDVFVPVFPRSLDPAHVRAVEIASRPAQEAFDLARAQIEALPAGAPFLAYVHVLDPHAPYSAPEPFRTRYTDPGYHGPVTGTILDFVVKEEIRTNPANLAQLEAYYDGEIAYTDDALGRFVDWLRASDRLRSTLVVVTADHGEQFLEHGDLGHGLPLFEEVVRVPLLFLGPGVPHGRTSDALVGLVDVTPTILDLLGHPAPGGALQGRSLEPVWAGASSGAAEPAREALLLEGPGVGSVARPAGDVPRVARAVVDDRHKIVSAENVRGEPGWSELEVFDLRADPKEQHGRKLVAGAPATDEDAALVSLYERTVAEALATRGPAEVPSVALPADDLERLRGLGYVTP
ncbi:MAG TPA: sulfatase [Myxococcota bacterium]|jgi:arylsulfatase A-like enzyme|nr:sulfatase [Myxococcota bacterium]